MPDTRTLDLDALVLHASSHGPGDKMCVLEAVAFLAGEPWSDHPVCASPVIGAFVRNWNDSLPDDDRQSLKRYIPRLVGSKGTTEQEERRSWMALDWMVRVHTPAWLRLAGLTDQADLLAGLAEVDPASCLPTKPILQAVRSDADAAGDAAWAAARDAAWAAAWDAARDAAWAAAWDAAGDAAWAAVEPTKGKLQAAAHDLVDRMLKVTDS